VRESAASLTILRKRRPGARSDLLASAIPAVYPAATRLVREPYYGGRHELRGDRSLIGTAIEASVVASRPAATDST
jgi:hypothetical protein